MDWVVGGWAVVNEVTTGLRGQWNRVTKTACFSCLLG